MALLATGMLQWQTCYLFQRIVIIGMSVLLNQQDWELELVVSFMDWIDSGLRRKNVVDELCWIPSSKQTFDLRSFYRALHSSTQLSFPWKSIWKPKVPTKVSFFLWMVALGRI